MSSIADAIQDKCLSFGDRIIKLNDYLLEQASQKYDAGRQKYGMRCMRKAYQCICSQLVTYVTSCFVQAPALVQNNFWSSERRMKLASIFPSRDRSQRS